jgi:hypothetical protein
MTKARQTNRFRCGNVVVCEYVRTELNNKHTIIGAMSGDISVPSFPANIIISLYIEVFFPKSGRCTLEVSLHYNNLLVVQFKIQADVKDVSLPAIIALPSAVIQMAGEGDLEVRGMLDRGREQPILKRRVKIGAVQLSTTLPAA